MTKKAKRTTYDITADKLMSQLKKVRAKKKALAQKLEDLTLNYETKIKAQEGEEEKLLTAIRALEPLTGNILSRADSPEFIKHPGESRVVNINTLSLKDATEYVFNNNSPMDRKGAFEALKKLRFRNHKPCLTLGAVSTAVDMLHNEGKIRRIVRGTYEGVKRKKVAQ